MKNITERIKCMTLGLVLASVPLVGGCGDNTLTWQEEVKRLEGRVNTDTRERRYEDDMPGEAWLTFKLPEFSNQEIVWHENLEVQVLNMYQGKLYVVGDARGLREVRQYGADYVPFRYEAGRWVRIPLSEIPVAVYDTNMYPGNMALDRRKQVSVADKVEIFKDDRWRPSQRRIDPNFKSIPRQNIEGE